MLDRCQQDIGFGITLKKHHAVNVAIPWMLGITPSSMSPKSFAQLRAVG